MALPDLECACATVRRTARMVTQLYSQEMGGRMEPTQFSLLLALDRLRGESQAPLGQALGLDKTTLSRNLRLMEKNGWIEAVISEDRRARGYRLTGSGKKILAETKPGWLRAQAKLRANIKPGDWDTMLKVFVEVAEAAAR